MKRKNLGIKIILILLICIFIFKQFFIVSYITSVSMLPTIEVGSLILVKRSPRNISHGDIVSFLTEGERYSAVGVIEDTKYKLTGNEIFINRVIGLPNDRILFIFDEPDKDGVSSYKILRNGDKLDEPYLFEESRMDMDDVKEWADVFCKNVCPSNASVHIVTVPEGMIFVMGDNRNESHDSRHMGFISLKSVFGRYIRTIK